MNRRRVNLKFLLTLMLTVAAAGVGVHFVHGYQVKRQAGALRQQAERAEQDNDPVHAVEYLGRYLGYEPGDTEALAKFGELLDEAGKAKDSLSLRRRALAALEEVLRRDPDRHAVRRRQVKLALETGAFAAVVAHAEILLANDAALDDAGRAELEQQIGLAEELSRHYAEAVAAYKKASEHAPERIDLYLRRASLLRSRLDKPDEADEVLTHPVKGMIRAIQDRVPADHKDEVLFQAYLARARYYIGIFPAATGQRRIDLAAQVRKDVAEVQKRARAGTPEQVELYLVRAELAQADQDVAGARKILREGVAAWPEETRLSQALARHEAADGHIDEALTLIRKALKDAPDKARTEVRQDLADMLIQKGGRDELEEAKDLIAELRKSKDEDPRTLDYFEARLHALKDEWGRAAQILDRIGPLLAIRPRLQARVYILLGLCYERLLNPDQALLAYQQSLELDPISVTARRGVASMLLALERLPDALREYRNLVAFARRPLDTRVQVARLLIQQKLGLPRAQRRGWDDVKGELDLTARELAAIGKAHPKSADVARLRAEVFLMQTEVLLLEDPKQVEQARARLQKEVKDRPGAVELWVALAKLRGAEKKAAQALAILQEAEKRLPQEDDKRLAQARRFELRLARLPYLVSQPEAEARRALAAEEKALAPLTGQARFRFVMGLAEAYARIGAAGDAERLWRQAADEQPSALVPRLALLDQALRANKDAEVKGLVEEVRQIEGDLGAFWRFGEAGRRVVLAGAESKQGHGDAAKKLLSEARGYLDDAGRRRPGWYRVPALRGEIADLDGDGPAAATYYQQAVTLGDRRPEVIRRLVQRQLELKRYADAGKVLRDLQGQEQTLLLAGLGKLASLTKLESGDQSGALELALRAVSPDSKESADHLFLGQVYAAAGKKEEAEKAFRRACDLAGDNPDPWVWLVAFLTGSGQKAKAEVAIDAAKKALPPERSALALAACYADVGNAEQAEKHYQAALARQPDDRRVLRSVATYYILSGQPQKAEPHLRKLLGSTSGEELAWVRRTLASVLGVTVNRAQYEEALALIDQNLKADGNSVPDLRTKAMLLANRSYQRKPAIRLLEELRREHPLTADEQFTLFQLYEADGNWPEAQKTMLVLLDSPEGRKNAVYKARYARRLVRRGEIDEAERQLEDLKRLAKSEGANANPFLAKEIEARVLRARGKHQEAAALLTTYAEAKGADLAGLALLCDEFSQQGDGRERYRDAAEGLYKRYTTQSKSPERWLVLASFYARQARLDEALRCCEEAGREKALPFAVGNTMVASLRAGEAKPEQYQRVDRWLQGAAQGENADALSLVLADLRDLQGRYQEAESLYANVLRKNPNNVLAINNLAWLLALNEHKGDEALALVDRGLALVGPSPELLDTRAAIYMTVGRGDDAVKDLQESIDQSPSAPRYFHLAQAQLLAKHPPAAVEAMRKAKESGLQLKQLHPLEQPAYHKLMDKS